jgi:cytochrome c2
MPARAVPGTKMVYIGLRDVADRAALICFLEQKTRGS